MRDSGGALRSVLVLGGGGLVGTAVREALSHHGAAVLAPTSREVDLRQLEALRACVRDCSPSVVINTAAQAQVDAAEQDSDNAFAVNALGAHNVAIAAAEAGSVLVHVSTDYVFDGLAGRPYREVDLPGLPPSQYGQSKLLGEQLVRQVHARCFIVRVAAVFGPGRKTFVDWVMEQASPSKPLTIVDDRFVSPSYSLDIAAQIVTLAKTPYFGTYHSTGHGVCSWYELARTALELSGRDTGGVTAVSDAQLGSVAPRPPYSALDNHLLRLRGMDLMRDWKDALADYIATR